MRASTPWSLAVTVILAVGQISLAQTPYPFEDPQLSLEQRVTNILSLMTIEEKTSSFGTSTAVPRLKIPDAGSSEGLHGLGQGGGFGGPSTPTTSFPEVIGMGSIWDPALIRSVAAVQAIEARYITQSAKYKHPALVIWGPNADLARDPRWGRDDESYGEDPFFDGTMATAFVKGLQGDDPDHWETASLLKHFLSNSNETTRGRSSSNYDEALFWDYYSVPFRMAIEDGGAKSLMASYNACEVDLIRIGHSPTHPESQAPMRFERRSIRKNQCSELCRCELNHRRLAEILLVEFENRICASDINQYDRFVNV